MTSQMESQKACNTVYKPQANSYDTERQQGEKMRKNKQKMGISNLQKKLSSNISKNA